MHFMAPFQCPPHRTSTERNTPHQALLRSRPIFQSMIRSQNTVLLTSSSSVPCLTPAALRSRSRSWLTRCIARRHVPSYPLTRSESVCERWTAIPRLRHTPPASCSRSRKSLSSPPHPVNLLEYPCASEKSARDTPHNPKPGRVRLESDSRTFATVM